MWFAHLKYQYLVTLSLSEAGPGRFGRQVSVTDIYHTIPYHAILYHTIPYHTIPYQTTPYHTIPYHAIPCHTIPYHTIPYHTLPYHTRVSDDIMYDWLAVPQYADAGKVIGQFIQYIQHYATFSGQTTLIF